VTTGASRVTGSTSSPYTAVRTTSFASPIETLKLEEVRRTRAFTMVALPCSLIVLAVLMVLPGDPVGRWAGGAGMFCIAASSIAVRIMLRRDEGYRLGPVLVFGYACVAGAYGAIYFFGAFSPAVAIIPFGLYFFSLSQSFRATLSVTVSCMVLQAALGFGTTFGVLTDHGLIQGGELGVTARVVIVLLVEMVFIATFLVARAGRGAMVQALEVHDRDLRALAQREALLKEARQELERALVAGGLGRFSDQELGSFKLGRVIGRGGMGEVYEASHQKTGAGAAVKLLHSPATTDGGVLRRFMREAQIASKLRSPNVVEVLEVGGTEAAMPYIAMELLEGSDLADLLRKHRRLSMHRVLQLSDEVARGLEAARAEGIVHRDLKPRNLFLVDRKDRKPVWKILDFGVSKLVDTQGTLTRDHLVGTPSYMAPEQASGGKVDHRADLYALGVICYRSLTGRPAFPGDGIPDILYKVLHTMPPRPSELVRVSGDVDLVLAVAMAKRPEDRFETALELAQALRLAHEGRLPRETRERGMAAEDASPWGETRG
jgi:hypothetical protein